MKRDKYYGCWKDENGRLYRQIGAARKVRTDVITERSRLWDFAEKENETDTEGFLTYITVYGRKIPLSDIWDLSNPFSGEDAVKIMDIATGKKEVTLNGQETEYPYRLFFSVDAGGETMRVFEFLGKKV